jgi:hypothetical protein
MADLLTGPVRLSLLIGPVVAVPVPAEVIDALDGITVVNSSGGTPSGFELAFTLDRGSPLNLLFLLTGGAMTPLVRVIVAITVRGSTSVLIDGVMTQHELQTPGPGQTKLVVRGKDLTAVMDKIDFDGLPYPAMPAFARATFILAKYVLWGCVPVAVPSVPLEVPLPIDRILRHQGTDYGYLSQLATSVGWKFYIDPGPAPGMSIAYWGPELRIGVPQPALNADLDAPDNNVTAMSFTFDKEKTAIPIVYIQEQTTKVPIGLPIPVSPLAPPLGLIPPIPPAIRHLKYTARLSPVGAIVRGMAYVADHSDAVQTTGSLDVARYGRLLRARQLVGVRGAGPAFDGLHFVKQVTTTIKRGSMTQSFTLVRGGLLSTVPAVPA